MTQLDQKIASIYMLAHNLALARDRNEVREAEAAWVAAAKDTAGLIRALSARVRELEACQ